jgi:cell division protein FtsB
MTRARRLAVVAVLGGVGFGAFGGEYGTFDWWKLRRDLTRETAVLDSLRAEMDSLRTEARLLERDPETQERVARERFGMLRPGELMFVIEEPPSDR